MGEHEKESAHGAALLRLLAAVCLRYIFTLARGRGPAGQKTPHRLAWPRHGACVRTRAARGGRAKDAYAEKGRTTAQRPTGTARGRALKRNETAGRAPSAPKGGTAAYFASASCSCSPLTWGERRERDGWCGVEWRALGGGGWGAGQVGWFGDFGLGFCREMGGT